MKRLMRDFKQVIDRLEKCSIGEGQEGVGMCAIEHEVVPTLMEIYEDLRVMENHKKRMNEERKALANDIAKEIDKAINHEELGSGDTEILIRRVYSMNNSFRVMLGIDDE